MSNLFTIKKLDINNVDLLTKQKMLFIFNSLENGWTISKRDDNYVFTKKHNNSSEVLSEQFLKSFILNNFN
jgi:hypothetical protein